MNSPLNLSLWIENPSVAFDVCPEKGGVAPIGNMDEHRSHLDGTGNGYGNGDGYGYGDGNGDGDGNGNGYGYGYGYGGAT
jgi:hypothetical protein